MLPWSFSGSVGGFLDGTGDGGGLIPALPGALSLLSPSAAGLWGVQGSVALSMAAVAEPVVRIDLAIERSRIARHPSLPAFAGSRSPRTDAGPRWRHRRGRLGPRRLLRRTFRRARALLGLAALSIGPLVMASARLRPQAYIALLERPG